MTDDEKTKAVLELQAEAQKAAEKRVNDMFHRFHLEMEGDETAWDDYKGMGAYCGCETCLVREILGAAWPYLWKAAELVLK